MASLCTERICPPKKKEEVLLTSYLFSCGISDKQILDLGVASQNPCTVEMVIWV